ncbi:MAG: hypothetical protein Q7R39_02445 [Dehalococcoidia bacterium]|nr:hypothetical protein [Dehalococcoidia bacterium]
MSDKKESRFAELAMELMGAQFAQKMIQEIWDAASPEVKQSLANEMLVFAAKPGDDWPLRQVITENAKTLLGTAKGQEMIERFLGETIVKQINEYDIRRHINEAVHHEHEQIIYKVVKEALEPLEAAVKAKVLEALKP